jgi:hypothetical protein
MADARRNDPPSTIKPDETSAALSGNLLSPLVA